MARTLYDAVPSSNSDRTKIALHEKGLAYDRVTLNLSNKDQKRPDFLKLNPYGKVPVLDDDGKILFESCIINEYLDEKYPDPPLMPKDPYLRGRGRVLVDYGLNYMHEPYWALRGEMLKAESERKAPLIEEQRQALHPLMQYLEAALDDTVAPAAARAPATSAAVALRSSGSWLSSSAATNSSLIASKLAGPPRVSSAPGVVIAATISSTRASSVPTISSSSSSSP
jgi:glutathione S-transferase